MRPRQIRKMLKLVKRFDEHVYTAYTKHVLIMCPTDDFINLPSKRTMTKIIEKELNPQNDKVLTLLIKQYLDTKYSTIGAKK